MALASRRAHYGRIVHCLTGEMMRRISVAAVAAVLALVLPAAVWAAGADGSRPVNQQVVQASGADVTTASTQWRDVIAAEAWCPTNHLGVATVSLSLKGGSAPVVVRVQGRRLPEPEYGEHDVLTARPNAVPFAVTASDSRAFTFSVPLDQSGGVGRRVVAQWRSPSGRPATITASSLHVVYARSESGCL